MHISKIFSVFHILAEIIAQDCGPVVSCITGYGGSVPITNLPDFSAFHPLTYRAFLQTICSQLDRYAKCQMYNQSLMTSCSFIGEFGISATQYQKTTLAQTQCLYIDGIVNSTSCLLMNSTLDSTVTECNTNMATSMKTANTTLICRNIFTAWKLCILEHVQNMCCSLVVDYWTTLTQKYSDILCTNSVATIATINVYTCMVILMLSLYIQCCFFNVVHFIHK